MAGRKRRPLAAIAGTRLPGPAIKKSEPIIVNLRNYPKSCDLFHNRPVIKPLRDNRCNVDYLQGVQDDITEQVNDQQEIDKLPKELELSAGYKRSTHKTFYLRKVHDPLNQL